jgi:hypothetical protein
MNRGMKSLMAILSVLALARCASIVDGSSQSLSVKTTSENGDVTGASCQLDSNKGSWFVVTPGSVTVHRSADALNVKCTKDGYRAAVNAIPSTTKGMAFGNLLFGGLIGAGVDVSTGAAYDYPNLITIPMQTNTVVTLTPVPQLVAVSPGS